ncbi:MAG: hypothetical protein DRH08_13360 [Deltaproteobacteria bacterium]|nr:MAG: hypothetical protein DRH08_13360 [Deltaproteobacteria bacterium]
MYQFRVLYFSFLLGLGSTAFGQVYESTDSEGITSFSDTPSAGSTAIHIPETNVGDSVEVPAYVPKPEPKVASEPEAVPRPEIKADNNDDDYNRLDRRRPGVVNPDPDRPGKPDRPNRPGTGSRR